MFNSFGFRQTIRIYKEDNLLGLNVILRQAFRVIYRFEMTVVTGLEKVSEIY